MNTDKEVIEAGMREAFEAGHASAVKYISKALEMSGEPQAIRVVEVYVKTRKVINK